MRRRVVSVALVVALALTGAARANARAPASGGQTALGAEDQAALVPGTHRDQRVWRPVEGRAPHGSTPALLATTQSAPARPSLAVLGRVRPTASAVDDASGSTRTSRGPPPPPAARL